MHRPVLLVLLVLAGTAHGSDPRPVEQRAESLVRTAIDHIRNGRPEALRALGPPGQQARASDAMVEELRTVIGATGPLKLEQALWGVDTRVVAGQPPAVIHEIAYQLKTERGYFWVQTKSTELGGELRLLGLHLSPVPGDLRELNAFTLKGKTVAHLGFLLLVLAPPAVIAYALFRLVRSRLRFKWAWALFALFGIGFVQLDWTRGTFSFHPSALTPLGFTASQSHPFMPWVFAAAFPVGAVVLLVQLRRKAAAVDAAVVVPGAWAPPVAPRERGD